MEIEIRAKINSLTSIENKLNLLKARFIKKVKQVDKYYGEISLYKKLNHSFLIRIRKEGNKNILNYKGAKRKKDGIWEEHETEINNPKEAELILKNIGFEKVIEVYKNRLEYKLNNLNICLDKIKGLGNFIEIEEINKNAISKKNIIKLMKDLGISKNEIINQGYVTLLLRKNKNKFSKYIIN